MLRMNPINLYLSVCARYIQVMLKSFGARISYWNSLLSFAVKRLEVFFFCAFILASWNVKGVLLLFCVYVVLCGVIINIKP